jgi:GrpB-like predicted nucleotidyltransferase (UPF0157 family)
MSKFESIGTTAIEDFGEKEENDVLVSCIGVH